MHLEVSRRWLVGLEMIEDDNLYIYNYGYFDIFHVLKDLPGMSGLADHSGESVFSLLLRFLYLAWIQ